MWSAIPVVLLCMIVNCRERKQGSGPVRDFYSSVYPSAHPSVCLSIHLPQALPGLESTLPGLESALPGLESALSGLQSTLSGLESGRVDFRPKRTDFRPKRADFRPEGVDFRPERADFGPERIDFRSEWADHRPERACKGQTNKSPPVFYRILSPLKLPLKNITGNHKLSMDVSILFLDYAP